MMSNDVEVAVRDGLAQEAGHPASPRVGQLQLADLQFKRTGMDGSCVWMSHGWKKFIICMHGKTRFDPPASSRSSKLGEFSPHGVDG